MPFEEAGLEDRLERKPCCSLDDTISMRSVYISARSTWPRSGTVGGRFQPLDRIRESWPPPCLALESTDVVPKVSPCWGKIETLQSPASLASTRSQRCVPRTVSDVDGVRVREILKGHLWSTHGRHG